MYAWSSLGEMVFSSSFFVIIPDSFSLCVRYFPASSSFSLLWANEVRIFLAICRKSSGRRDENDVTGFTPGREKMFICSLIFCSLMMRRSIPIRYASGTSSVSIAMQMKFSLSMSIVRWSEKRAYACILAWILAMFPMCRNIILSCLIAFSNVSAVNGCQGISPLRSSFT